MNIESEFDRLWAELLRMSGNPTEVDSKSVTAMRNSLRRIQGISADMRERLAYKIERKQCEVAIRDMA